MVAEDGLHFSKTHDIINVPTAAGAYRPEAFTDSEAGTQVKWGVHIGKQKKALPFIERFELEDGNSETLDGIHCSRWFTARVGEYLAAGKHVCGTIRLNQRSMSRLLVENGFAVEGVLE
ncbi:hypothetical protein ACFL6U_22490 [Planctomycetota bacterium]